MCLADSSEGEGSLPAVLWNIGRLLDGPEGFQFVQKLGIFSLKLHVLLH